jgi:hypothetical protein
MTMHALNESLNGGLCGSCNGAGAHNNTKVCANCGGSGRHSDKTAMIQEFEKHDSVFTLEMKFIYDTICQEILIYESEIVKAIQRGLE